MFYNPLGTPYLLRFLSPKIATETPKTAPVDTGMDPGGGGLLDLTLARGGVEIGVLDGKVPKRPMECSAW